MTHRILPVIAVYGRWPRSGTTMLMRVLEAGCGAAIRDFGGQYAADWGCRKAMYAPVELLSRATSRAAVKLWAPQLRDILAAELAPVAVVTPLRPWRESNASWEALDWAPLAAEARLGARWSTTIDALTAAGANCVQVGFHALIDDPVSECARLAEKLGGDWDIEAMAAVPVVGRRHHGTPA